MKRVFEWDGRKAELNLRLHGVLFEDALLVFDDPRHTIALNRFSDEKRLEAVGLAHGSLILVVIHRVIDEDTDDEVTRIISARPAERRERQGYWAQGEA